MSAYVIPVYLLAAHSISVAMAGEECDTRDLLGGGQRAQGRRNCDASATICMQHQKQSRF